MTDLELDLLLELAWWRQEYGTGISYAARLALLRPTPPAHCDDLVLHAPRQCEYCDRHQSWQVARIRLGIAFTGNAWNEKGTTLRPCPATLLRSVETIERWYGNVPTTEKAIEDEVTEAVARWNAGCSALTA